VWLTLDLSTFGLAYLGIDAPAFDFDLVNRADKPGAGPDEPGADGEDSDDADGNNGVVERLGANGVIGRKAEDDGDEADPANANEGDGARGEAEVEGAFFRREGAVVD
jgi:hypothetical protein